VCRKRSFFVIKEGRLGIGDRAIEDNTIVLFAAAKPPFVVRKAEEDDCFELGEVPHELIGKAYVHGLMDGEGYCGPLADAVQDEWITLV
jgi:hypothetical protein